VELTASYRSENVAITCQERVLGQDMEGTLGDDAEGGARHIIGPALSAALWSDRISLVGGLAVAVGQGQRRVLGRSGLAGQF
jgi:hypothetical protein